MPDLDLIVSDILKVSSSIIGTRTVFISEFKKSHFKISKILNNGGIRLEEGQEFKLEETLCQNIYVDNTLTSLVIHDTLSDHRVKSLFATKNLKIGSYVAIPITLNSGKLYGTLCAADPNPNIFNQQQIDEMNRLARILAYIIDSSSINQFSEEENIRIKSLSVLREMVADLADQIGNPLQILKGFYQWADHDVEAMTKYKDVLVEELNKIDTKLKDVIIQTSPTFPRKEQVSIFQMVFDILDSINKEKKTEVKIELTINPTNRKFTIDKEQISFVLRNIIGNALDAVDKEKGIVKIRCFESNYNLVFSIEDNGGGIKLDDMQKITQPFYSSKKEAKGLGLTIANQIIEGHGGELLIDTEQTGTTVCIHLPLSTQ
ncbi:ATP-binding protein [Bacillus alkalicellulosilyticus]|uniref:ATP-binding protein n=1 Tax=Alkalihalobacterium alkalicellulosilyticum TaxID=1912214 RepID=UPI000996DE54|nr:ATP-binding protein [Bacillus alkalicellulosilyticus]